jgi:hypothetical protein
VMSIDWPKSDSIRDQRSRSRSHPYDVTELSRPIELIRPPPHHPHALLPELGGMGVGATDFIRLLMGKPTFDRIRLPFSALVQER